MSQAVEKVQDLILALQTMLITIKAVPKVPVQQRTGELKKLFFALPARHQAQVIPDASWEPLQESPRTLRHESFSRKKSIGDLVPDKAVEQTIARKEAKQMEENMLAVTPAVRGTSSGVCGKVLSPFIQGNERDRGRRDRTSTGKFQTGPAGPFSRSPFHKS